MAVVASATGAAVFGLSGVAAGLAGGALLGAGAGALYSGITGDGDILNSALTGGLIGGGIGGLGAALAPAAAGGAAGAASGAAGAAGSAGSAGLAAATPEAIAATANTPAMAASILEANAAADPIMALNASQGWTAAAPSVVQGAAPVTGANTAIGAQLANASADPIMAAANMSGMSASDLAASGITPAAGPGLTNMEMLGYGLAGTTALSLLGGMNQKKIPTQPIGQNPAYIRPATYSISQNPSAFPTGPQYGANGLPILPTSEKSYFNQSYVTGTPYKAANGGLMAVPPVPTMMQSGPANVNFMGNDMYPTSQQYGAHYATPTQMPTSAQQAMASYEPKTNPLTGQSMQSMAGGGQINLQGTFSEGNSSQPQGANGYSPAGGNPWGGGQFSSQGGFPPPQGLGGVGGTGIDPRSINRTGVAPTGYMSGLPHRPFDMSILAGSPMNNSIQFAAGGVAGGQYNLGSYSDGGRLLKGPGDGVSDDIPAVIGDKQPARLADGEFVVPARIVSELGNGSTDAGAKRLYAMMDRIQSGRKKTVGKDKVAVNTKAEKHLPA